MEYEEEYQQDVCDICYEEITSSHYHCGNCGGESGMMGHYKCEFVHEREWNPNYEEDPIDNEDE